MVAVVDVVVFVDVVRPVDDFGDERCEQAACDGVQRVGVRALRVLEACCEPFDGGQRLAPAQRRARRTDTLGKRQHVGSRDVVEPGRRERDEVVEQAGVVERRHFARARLEHAVEAIGAHANAVALDVTDELTVQRRRVGDAIQAPAVGVRHEIVGRHAERLGALLVGTQRHFDLTAVVLQVERHPPRRRVLKVGRRQLEIALLRDDVRVGRRLFEAQHRVAGFVDPAGEKLRQVLLA
mmetsp:Transcript_15236/g.26192  ORF Transcript_15236/g.26192 Transcript_15236/m.26192 type:complete len:238 (+) Transcript_15236:725-1438(+)